MFHWSYIIAKLDQVLIVDASLLGIEFFDPRELSTHPDHGEILFVKKADGLMALKIDVDKQSAGSCHLQGMQSPNLIQISDLW